MGIPIYSLLIAASESFYFVIICCKMFENCNDQAVAHGHPVTGLDAVAKVGLCSTNSYVICVPERTLTANATAYAADGEPNVSETFCPETSAPCCTPSVKPVQSGPTTGVRPCGCADAHTSSYGT